MPSVGTSHGPSLCEEEPVVMSVNYCYLWVESNNLLSNRFRNAGYPNVPLFSARMLRKRRAGYVPLVHLICNSSDSQRHRDPPWIGSASVVHHDIRIKADRIR